MSTHADLILHLLGLKIFTCFKAFKVTCGLTHKTLYDLAPACLAVLTYRFSLAAQKMSSRLLGAQRGNLIIPATERGRDLNSHV